MVFGKTTGWNGRRKGREIFFVACGCSFGIKCHTVNVKGGEERRGEAGSGTAQLADNASSRVSLFFFFVSSMFSNLRYVSPPAVFEALLRMLFDCHQHLAPRPGFTPQYACRSTCLHAHTHTHPHPFKHPQLSLSYIHAQNPIASVRLFQRDNWSEQEERESALVNGFIYVPVPQLSNISITYSERRTRVTQEMFWGLEPQESASLKWACIINHTYISHSFK